MALPTALTQAAHAGRLLVLWGALPFPLAAHPPANRALALDGLPASPELAGRWPEWLPRLPPLPILSLDATARLERAFRRAGVFLQVVSSRRVAPAYDRHVLLKLAGDLETRQGVVLSRAEVKELRNDPDKRCLLAEARRRVTGGALLLLGCEPGSEDFRVWWSALTPTFRDTTLFAVGEPAAAWPAGVVCLGPDFASLNAALWAAQPPEPEVEAQADVLQPQAAARYVINIYGPVDGLAIGDRARIEQRLGAPLQTEGDWEALIAQVAARLDALSAQLGRGVGDLKRGQAALYRQVDRAYRDDLARVLTAVQQGRLEQGEMQATLDALRRAMRAVMARGLPMDAELRAAVADLTEAVESSLSLERKLELSLPLFPPFLEYKVELAVDSAVDLHDLWAELRRRWQQLVEQVRRKEKPRSGQGD